MEFRLPSVHGAVPGTVHTDSIISHHSIKEKRAIPAIGSDGDGLRRPRMSAAPDALDGPEIAPPEGAPGSTFPHDMEGTTVHPLMRSLGAPRVSFKKHGPKDQKPITAVDGSAIPHSKLPLLRVSDQTEILRTISEEADAVRALNHAVTDTGVSSTGLENIHRMQARRKVRHDDALRGFESFQRVYYSELEDRVLALGRSLRTALSTLDAELHHVLQRVNDPALMNPDLTWLLQQQALAEDVDARRQQTVQQFLQDLEGIESTRCRVVGDRLQQLGALLLDIGHELTGGVERIVEDYASELNAVLVTNRKEHVEVGAKMERTLISLREDMRAAWAGVEQTWRMSQHRATLQGFSTLLASEQYCNPPARARAMAELGIDLTQRHTEQRLPLLEELSHLRPPQLTVQAVASIRERFRAIEEADSRTSEQYMQNVRRCQDAAVASARSEMEIVRRRIHSYEALVPSGQLQRLGGALSTTIQHMDSAETQRPAALRSELEAIVVAAQAPEVVYDAHLTALHNRVGLLVEYLSVASAMEVVGKAAERSVLIATLDTLRSARRTDIPGLLVKLHRLASSMLRVAGMPSAVCTELDAIADAIGDIIEDLHEGIVAAGAEPPQSLQRFLFPDKFPSSGSVLGGGSSVIGGAARASVAGSILSPGGRGSVVGAGKSTVPKAAPSAAGKSTGAASRRVPAEVAHAAGGGSTDTKHVAGRSTERPTSSGPQSRKGSMVSRRSGSAKRSVAGRTSATRTSQRGSILSEMTDPLSQVLGNVLPLALIRALQRRLTIVACAADLPHAAQDALRQLAVGCQRQRVANETVDGVVSKECELLISMRAAQGAQLIQQLQKRLYHHHDVLCAAEHRICTLFAEAASVCEQHLVQAKAVDEWASEELAGALDDFEAQHDVLEAQYRDAVVSVTQAPDLNELEVAAARAMQCLQSIEDEYRRYHDIACRWARQHPVRVQSVLRCARQTLCSVFATRCDVPMIDGEPIPGESLFKLLPWDMDGPRATRAGDVAEQPAPVEPSAASKFDTRPASSASANRSSASARIPNDYSPRSVTPAQAGDDGRKDADRASVRIPALESAPLQPLHQADALDSARPSPGSALTELLHAVQQLAALGGSSEPAYTPERVAVASSVLSAQSSTGSDVPYTLHVPSQLVGAFLGQPNMLLKQVARQVRKLDEARAAAKAKAEAEAEAAAAAAAAATVSTKDKRASAGKTAAPAAATSPTKVKVGKGGKPEEQKSESRPGSSEGARKPSGSSPRLEPTEVRTSASASTVSTDHRPVIAAVEDVVVDEGLSDDEAKRYGIFRVVFDPAALGAAFRALCLDLLQHLQHYARERRDVAEELMHARIRSLTAELDEHLRCHWPRKGELEVTACGPRREQLVEHRQRLDRLIRSTREKDAQEAAHAAARLRSAREAMQAGLSDLQQLQGQLPSLDTVAALQGVQARVRQLKSRLHQQTQKFLHDLRDGITTATARLIDAVSETLKACKTFDAGGSYAAAEVREYQRSMDELAAELKATASARLSDVDALESDMQLLWTTFQRFDTEFDSALKQLSLRQGLGAHYGAPRRDAQERIRSTYGWSELAANAIDSRLDELAQLLRGCQPGSIPDVCATGVPDTEEQLAIVRAGRGIHDASAVRPSTDTSGTAAPPKDKDAKASADTSAKGAKQKAAGKERDNAAKESKDPGAAPPDASTLARTMAAAASAVEEDEAVVRRRGRASLALRIRRCVLVLRDAMFERAVFLAALKVTPDLLGPPRKLGMPFLSLSDAPAIVGMLLEQLLPQTYGSVLDPNPLVWPDGGAEMAHTLRGPAPSSVHARLVAQPTLQQIIMSALDGCRAATVRLFASEGITIASDDDLPASVREFMRDEIQRLGEVRESSMRRLREQVDRVHELLPEAPDLMLQDIMLHESRRANEDRDSRMKVLSAQLDAFEDVRLAHVDQLRLVLADPNARSALHGLVINEDRRVSDVLACITTADSALASNAESVFTVTVAKVAHAAALFALTVDEVITRADLAALPGDELVVPKKMSFLRLNKSLRKSGIDAAAAVVAAAMGAVETLSVDDQGCVITGDGSKDSAPAAKPQSVPVPPSSRGDAPGSRTGSAGAAKGQAAPSTKAPTASSKLPPTSSAARAPSKPVHAQGAPTSAEPSFTAPSQSVASAGADGSTDTFALKGGVAVTRGWVGVAATELLPHAPARAAALPLATVRYGAFTAGYSTVVRHCFRAREAAIATVREAMLSQSDDVRSRLAHERQRAEDWKALWTSKSEALRLAAAACAPSPGSKSVHPDK